MSVPTSSYLDALQTTLAGEHAAVYVLGYLGAQTSASSDPRLAAALVAAYSAHRARRDQVTSRIIADHGTPVAAAAFYDLPDLTTVAEVEAGALRIEHACAATYDFLVANASGDDRRWAVTLLLDAAIRGLGFGGHPETYPGR